MTTAKSGAAIDPIPLTAAKPSELGPVGWDPYEVWRSRILLPRLVEEARPIRSKEGSGPRAEAQHSLVVRTRSLEVVARSPEPEQDRRPRRQI